MTTNLKDGETRVGQWSCKETNLKPQELPKFPALHLTIHNSTEEQQKFFTTLSEQVGEWSRYNFGTQSSHRPAMGMVEELNELKMGLNQLNSHDVLDAVGDVTIYMADYFSIRGWDLGEAWRDRCIAPFVDPVSMVAQLSRFLSHYHLKGEQGIRGGSERHAISMRTTCAQTLWFLLSMSNFLGVDYIELVAKVWGTVQRRDWRTNKDNAHIFGAFDVSQELPQPPLESSPQPYSVSPSSAPFDPSQKLPQQPPDPIPNYEVGDEVHE